MENRHTFSTQRVLTPLGIGLALSLLGDATLYAVLPSETIAAQAGVTLATVGFLLGINRLVRIVFNGPAGLLYDRLPRRPLMLLSLTIGTLSTLFYAFGYGPLVMILGRVFWGMAWSGLWIGANTMALDISSENDRGKINGALQMWFFIGVAASSFAGGLFTDLFTYRGGLLVSSALSLVGLFIWLRYLPETRVNPAEEKSRDFIKKGRRTYPWKLTLSCALPYFVMRIIFAGVLAATTILWLAQFVDEGGFRLNGWAIPLATMTGAFIAVRVVVSVISAPQVGRISDRLGRRWLVLAVVLLVFGAGGLWLLSIPNFILSLIGALLSAVSGGSVPALIPAIVGDRVNPEQQSRTLGMIFTFGDLGSALGPPLALGLVPLVGLNQVFVYCAILYGLTAVFAILQAWHEHNHIQASAATPSIEPDSYL